MHVAELEACEAAWAAEIQRHKHAQEELKARLEATASFLLEAYPEAAHVLYWRHPLVPVSMVATALNVHENEVAKTVGPDGASEVCETCQQAISLTSRSARLGFQRKKHRKGGQICDDCRHKQYSVSSESLQILQARRASRLAELKAMPYADYLETDEWRDTARRARQRAHFKCQLCGDDGTLNVHHRSYERLGEEWYGDLIVLCAGCHARHHEVIPDGQ